MPPLSLGYITGSALGEEVIDGDVEGDRDGPESPATVDAGEDDGEQPGGTQVNQSSARVEVLPMSPSGVGRGCDEGGGGLMEGMEASSRPIEEGVNDEDGALTDEDEIRNTQGAEEEEDLKLTGGDVEGPQTTQVVDEMAGTERGEVAAGRGSIHGNNQTDDTSSTCTERSSTMRPPAMATLEERAVESGSVTKMAAESVDAEDGGEEVHQRLEEEAGDEEDSEGDGEGEFTVPSLNFSRDEKDSGIRGAGGLGDGDSNEGCGEGAQADSESSRDGGRSPLFETLDENDRETGRVL